ncbi:hypothetical protein B0J12DRAFT_252342 [Macrophomina phaseolina]|uniref:Secreted protein n=1 Tax=Macrophomina phaseolina TaxID=35725 RepID=A0ABQ8FZS9_9PEZI|nr:hypothetical protein B0J12DRAFT_252342 [Macrophomina phaseolina]
MSPSRGIVRGVVVVVVVVVRMDGAAEERMTTVMTGKARNRAPFALAPSAHRIFRSQQTPPHHSTRRSRHPQAQSPLRLLQEPRTGRHRCARSGASALNTSGHGPVSRRSAARPTTSFLSSHMLHLVASLHVSVCGPRKACALEPRIAWTADVAARPAELVRGVAAISLFYDGRPSFNAQLFSPARHPPKNGHRPRQAKAAKSPSTLAQTFEVMQYRLRSDRLMAYTLACHHPLSSNHCRFPHPHSTQFAFSATGAAWAARLAPALSVLSRRC